MHFKAIVELSDKSQFEVTLTVTGSVEGGDDFMEAVGNAWVDDLWEKYPDAKSIALHSPAHEREIVENYAPGSGAYNDMMFGTSMDDFPENW